MPDNTETNGHRGRGLIGDVPVGDRFDVEAYPKDHLDRNAYAEVLAESAAYTSDTITIGIYGDWGSGKTSMMQLMRAHIDKNVDSAIPVWFNAWQYEREEHLIVPFIATMNKALRVAWTEAETEDGLPKKLGRGFIEGAKKLHNVLRSVAYSVQFKVKGDVPLTGGVELGFSGKDAVERYEALAGDVALERSRYFDAYDKLASLANPSGISDGGIPKLVVFVDDLDRCMPDKAVMLLEDIKLVLGLPRFSFVLGIKDDIIQEFVQHTFAKNLNIRRSYFSNYLEKFVQVPVYVPEHDAPTMERYVKRLLTAHKSQLSGNEYIALREISALIAAYSHQNPRRTVRYINQVLVASRVARGKRRLFDETGHEDKTNNSVLYIGLALACSPIRAALLNGYLHFQSAISEQDVGEDAWPKDCSGNLPFGEGLSVLLRSWPPSSDWERLSERLRKLSGLHLNSFPVVAEALSYLADEQNVHMCIVLTRQDSLEWLTSPKIIRTSFDYIRSSISEMGSDFVDELVSYKDRETDDLSTISPLRITSIAVLASTIAGIPLKYRDYISDLKDHLIDHSISNLSLDYCTTLKSLDGIESLYELRSLSLSNCPALKSIDALMWLQKIEELSLRGNMAIEDFTPLSHLGSLKTLDLAGCKGVRDLNFLVELYELSRLELVGCNKIDSLLPLSACDNLVFLDIRGCINITDLRPLRRLKKMRVLAGMSGIRPNMIPDVLKDRVLL